MERIKKALERARSERHNVPNSRRSTANKKSNDIDQIDYTKTNVTPIDKDTLLENRIIANQENYQGAESFRMLRTQVLQKMRENNWKTLAICAATADAGKSFVSANLAISLALDPNQTVLLADLDLHRPSIHQYFSLTPEYGIRDHVEDDVPLEQILINPGIERLVLLPGKGSRYNASELLSTTKMSRLIGELKHKYDSRIVVFDLPPLLICDDPLVLFPHVDCTLFVVEDGRSTKEEIVDSLKMLESTNMLGTVLNKGEQSKYDYYY